MQLRVDNFDECRQLYGDATDLSRIGDNFQASLTILRVPRLVLHERRIEGVVLNRTWACIGRHGFDHVTLHLLRAGDFVSGPPGAERRLQPGEVAVLDTSRPHVSRMKTRADLLTVQLARAHVQEVLPDLSGIHGAILPANASRLLVGFLGSLIQQSVSLPADPLGHIASAAINLLGLALNGARVWTQALPTEAEDALRRRRVEAFIVGRLSDPSLDVDAIAAGVGISRSVLYRLFSADGGVRRFLQQQRLDGLRRALLDPGEGRRLGNLAYAYGFTTESHCSRAFAAAFGLPPGQFRNELRRTRADDGSGIQGEGGLIGLTKSLY